MTGWDEREVRDSEQAPSARDERDERALSPLVSAALRTRPHAAPDVRWAPSRAYDLLTCVQEQRHQDTLACAAAGVRC
jgi:hypothetical protein